MLAGLLCVVVLLAALFVRRSPARFAATPWQDGATRAEVLAGLGVTFVASCPVLGLLPWLSGNPRASWGDGMTHARVASDVATHGIPHGWVDSYLGGFPFFHHYPPAGWIASVALVKLGVSPENATTLLGGLGVLAAPMCVYCAAIWCGARPANAVPGALLVGWVSPYSPFVGGYEVFFQLGLLSQALGVPLAALLAAAVFRRGRAAPGVILAATTMAVHPQVGVAALLVIGVSAVVAFDRDVIRRWLRALAAGIVMGAALYGQGMRAMRIPFGWPKNKQWLQLGFPPERLSWWIGDGDLLDQDRVPILTALTLAALLAAILLSRRPAARGAAVAVATSTLLSVSGFALASTGAPGDLLLAFLQPLRMVAIVPLAAAAAVIVTFEEGGALLDAARTRLGRRTLAIAALLLLLALPSRIDAIFAKRALIVSQRTEPCGPATPTGYDHELVRTWLASEPRERLWYAHDTSALRSCALADGMELLVPGPIAITGGVGAHVGLQWLAFRKLDIERAGAAARADALGIRYVLRVEDVPVPEGLRLLHREGTVSLLVRDAPAYGIGVGCVRETWTGSNRALREEIERTLETPDGADRLLDPRALVALDVTAGAVTKAPVADDVCAFGQTEITERSREPGALEAIVKTDGPADVVFRATAFPSWRVESDGAPVGPIRMVAPGFFSVRVPAGQHRVVATASTLPGFAVVVLGGLLVVAALAFLDRAGIAAIRQRVRNHPG